MFSPVRKWPVQRQNPAGTTVTSALHLLNEHLPSNASSSCPPLSSVSSPHSPVRIYATSTRRKLVRSQCQLSLHHPQVTTPQAFTLRLVGLSAPRGVSVPRAPEKKRMNPVVEMIQGSVAASGNSRLTWDDEAAFTCEGSARAALLPSCGSRDVCNNLGKKGKTKGHLERTACCGSPSCALWKN